MKCKNCKAELAEGVSVCPECGADNAAPAKMDTSKKLTIVIIALVVLIAVLVGVIVMGMGGLGGGEDTTGAPETTGAPATVPEDGDPSNETCKGTYTADAEAVMAANKEIVATMGEHTLTNGQFQVYYWLSVYNFMNYNSSYLSYYGLDPAEDLDKQLCTVAEAEHSLTWQQYFVAEALLAWQRYQALTEEAEAAQYQLEEQFAEELTNLRKNMDEIALEDGYEDLQAMMDDQLGGGCTFEDYETYMYQYYMGYLYYDSLCGQITASDDEIRAFFDEHKDEYAENGLTEDYMFYDVRHALIEPEGGTTEGTTTTYSDEEWEACRVKAQALLDEWLANDGTEEGFADLAKEHSADSNADKGGIYEELTTDTNFVPEFKDWYLDESRTAGDSGLVKTTYGYHIMFYVGSQDTWYVTAEQDLITETLSALMPAAMEKYPMTVDYSAIKLGLVEFTAG